MASETIELVESDRPTTPNAAPDLLVDVGEEVIFIGRDQNERYPDGIVQGVDELGIAEDVHLIDDQHHLIVTLAESIERRSLVGTFPAKVSPEAASRTSVNNAPVREGCVTALTYPQWNFSAPLFELAKFTLRQRGLLCSGEAVDKAGIHRHGS